MLDEHWKPPVVQLTVDLVILTLRETVLHVLLVQRGVEPHRGLQALPGGFLSNAGEGLLSAAGRELREEANLDPTSLHLEQLGAYGEPGRDPRGRVVTVAFLAIAPGLPQPVAGTDAASASWVPVNGVLSGATELAFDHQQIVADGVERARSKLERSALATSFCGETFSISELHAVYEAVWGVHLDPRNFYRKLQTVPGFLVPAGDDRRITGGRPARLFRAGPRTVLHPPLSRPESTSDDEKRSAMSRSVVVLTALNVEYQALRRHLVDLQVQHERGTRFEVGHLPDSQCRVALAMTGQGNSPAAVLAERAIRRYSPAAVLFVGVAGALWDDIALGDVVVATRVHAYHGATSEDDGPKARPRTWEAAHAVVQTASHVAREANWATHLSAGESRPQVRFGSVAAGEVVQNSRISREAKWILDHYNDALAIEMESAGVAQAGHLGSTPVGVVRGISDRANGTKTGPADQEWQPRAAANAAAFAAALIHHLGTDEEQDMNENSPAESVQNTASGVVGIQAGRVSGSVVNIGASQTAVGPGDLTRALTALREQVTREHAGGNLDAPTFAAAEEELTTAKEALDAEPRDTGRFVLALKKLRGLVVEITSLATSIAALITAANIHP